MVKNFVKPTISNNRFERSIELKKFDIYKYLIYLIIILLIVILAIIIISLFSSEIKDDKAGDGKNNNPSGLNVEIKKCLEGEFTGKCKMTFADPDRHKECDSLGELKEKCHYLFAQNSCRVDFCDLIENPELRNKCFSNFEVEHD